MKFTQKIKTILGDKALRNKILFVFFVLALFRLLASIPVPGIDIFQLEGFLADNQFLGILNIFSGGGLSTVSIAMLGVGPYITASIVMQLVTAISPRIKAMYHENGQIGRKKFINLSRYLTIPFAVIQGFGLLLLLQQQGILGQMSMFGFASAIIIVTAGSVLLTWLGELVTEYGIGNGLSILIFAGIIAALPSQISQLAFSYDPSLLPTYIGFLAVAVAIVAGVVLVTEGERPVAVTYANQARGGGGLAKGSHTYVPLRINQAGVMPIIFAMSIMLFPQMLANILTSSGAGGFWANLSGWINTFLDTTWAYALAYFVLVFLFTYFYTAITFEPDSMAENLQKNGAFVPGIRPGAATSEYIGNIVTRITFVGAIFLGAISVLPILMQQITGISTLAIGGTALLIVVSVILDLLKKVDAQVTMREY
jgi:preprotein translocase subunit SecY